MEIKLKLIQKYCVGPERCRVEHPLPRQSPVTIKVNTEKVKYSFFDENQSKKPQTSTHTRICTKCQNSKEKCQNINI